MPELVKVLIVAWPIDCTAQYSSGLHAAPVSTHCAPFMSFADAFAPMKSTWITLVNTVLPQFFVISRRK